VGIVDEVETLRRIPLFAKMEPSKLKLLAFASERVVFESGQELFHQGDLADAAYILLDGDAAVVVDSPRGPLTVAEMGRNDFVGEIGVFCDIPRTATVVATSRLVTLRISKELFLQVIADFPVVALEVIRELAHRLEHTTIALREARAGLRAPA
jgi:CRP/FNR family transcriptional regulator, cyclic AMP receptor protein